MIFQKSQPAEKPTNSSLCLDWHTEEYGCINPRTKSARTRNTRKSWQHIGHLRTAMACTGRYEEEALHKAVVGSWWRIFCLWPRCSCKLGLGYGRSFFATL